MAEYKHPLDKFLDGIGSNRNQFAEASGLSTATLGALVSRKTPVANMKLDVLIKLADFADKDINTVSQMLRDYEEGNDVALSEKEREDARSYKFGELYGLLSLVAKGDDSDHDQFDRYLRSNMSNYMTKPAEYFQPFIAKAKKFGLLPDEYMDVVIHIINNMHEEDFHGAALNYMFSRGMADATVRLRDGDTSDGPDDVYYASIDGEFVRNWLKDYPNK